MHHESVKIQQQTKNKQRNNSCDVEIKIEIFREVGLNNLYISIHKNKVRLQIFIRNAAGYPADRLQDAQITPYMHSTVNHINQKKKNHIHGCACDGLYLAVQTYHHTVKAISIYLNLAQKIYMKLINYFQRSSSKYTRSLIVHMCMRGQIGPVVRVTYRTAIRKTVVHLIKIT